MKLNLSTKELDIQLKRQVNLLLSHKKIDLPRIHVLDTPTLEPNSELICHLPSRFRELRALAIIHWYLPIELKFEIQLNLRNLFPYSLDFENDGLQQSLQLEILTENKDIMLKYLKYQEEFQARELFGTILREDSFRALKNLEIYWKTPSQPRRKIRRKGYQDHGSRRPDHLWTEKFDYSFTEYQLLKEEKFEFLVSQISLLKKNLETWDPES
jgi:hypothetical protein